MEASDGKMRMLNMADTEQLTQDGKYVNCDHAQLLFSSRMSRLKKSEISL